MYELISANKRRSVALVALFVVVVAAAGWGFSLLMGYGWVGIAVAAAVAVTMAAASYWKSDAVALAMSRARPADPADFARLHNVVEGLALAAGIPKPRVYVVDDPAPNAFATGRNPQHAAVAVTTGLLDRMNRAELEGVVAHELSHVRNYDILVATLAVTLVGTVVLLSDWGLRFMWFGGGRRDRSEGSAGLAGAVMAMVGVALLVITPLLARLMQLAVSRRRESLADVSGVELTRYPAGLIAALEKLRDDSTVVRSASRATAHLWIEQPTAQTKDAGTLSWLNRLFNTHPPLEERIAALRSLMASEPAPAPVT